MGITTKPNRDELMSENTPTPSESPVAVAGSGFAEHREQTAKDCEQIAGMITDLAAKVREGNMKAFESFWWQGGTEEGDAKISALRENLILRYALREQNIQNSDSPT